MSKTNLRIYPIRINNILDSSGSVSEAFINQIKERTIFITHPDIKRNFLMKEDAVKLILQALVTASSSSAYKGKVPVVTKGVATRIFDLGVKLIRLMGLQPEKEVSLKFTGLRLGESVKENEKTALMLNTEHKDISMACPPIKEASLMLRLIENLEEAANDYNEKRVIVILKNLVPEYNAMRQGDFSVYEKGQKIRAEDLL